MFSAVLFAQSPQYRTSVLQELCQTVQGRALLLEIVQDLSKKWLGMPLMDRLEVYKINLILRTVQYAQIDAQKLFPAPVLAGISPLGWVGIAALGAVAVAGLSVAALPAGAVAGIGAGLAKVGTLIVAGGAVAATGIKIALTWSMAHPYIALGLSIGLLFAADWAYSSIVDRKSAIEKVLTTGKNIIKAIPSTVKMGMTYTIVIIGLLVAYNLTTKGKQNG